MNKTKSVAKKTKTVAKKTVAAPKVAIAREKKPATYQTTGAYLYIVRSRNWVLTAPEEMRGRIGRVSFVDAGDRLNLDDKHVAFTHLLKCSMDVDNDGKVVKWLSGLWKSKDVVELSFDVKNAQEKVMFSITLPCELVNICPEKFDYAFDSPYDGMCLVATFVSRVVTFYGGSKYKRQPSSLKWEAKI